MNDPVIALSERGQLTIPKKMRAKLPVSRFICRMEGEKIILEPLRTNEEFLSELEMAEREWKNKGGLTLNQIKKKYKV